MVIKRGNGNGLMKCQTYLINFRGCIRWGWYTKNDNNVIYEVYSTYTFSIEIFSTDKVFHHEIIIIGKKKQGSQSWADTYH